MAPDPSSPWYVPTPAGPISSIIEDACDHPDWQTLQHGGTGDFLRAVEWEANTGDIRVSGPIVVNNPPVAPAP